MTARKSIIFDSVPLNKSVLGDAKNIERPGSGALLSHDTAARAILDYVRAMLKHSNYDRFVFLSCRERRHLSFADCEDITSSPRDVVILHPTEIGALQDLEGAVLVTSTERLGPMVRLRHLFKEPTPAIGFWHATHPSFLAPILSEMILGGVAKFDALVCPSDRSRKALLSLMDLLWAKGNFAKVVEGPRTPVIPLAIDSYQVPRKRDAARRIFGFAESDVVLLFFGHLDGSKSDLGPLLLAFSRLRRTSATPVRLVLAGTVRGDFSSSVKAFAQTILCADGVSVHACALDHERMDLYAAADIFVSMSEAVDEPCGSAILEAMVSGLPCVVSDWGGNCEIVLHGQNGFVIPTLWSKLGACVHAFESCGVAPQSTMAATTVVDVDSMEYHLRLLIDNVNLRYQMGQAACEHVRRRFDWSVVVGKYDSLFDLHRSLAREASLPMIHEIALQSSTQKLFGHYPTTVMQPDTLLALTEHGRNWMRAPCRLGIAVALHELISEELAREIVEIIEPRDSLSLKEIIHYASQAIDVAPWVIGVNVMRLIKYGIVGRSGCYSTVDR